MRSRPEFIKLAPAPLGVSEPIAYLSQGAINAIIKGDGSLRARLQGPTDLYTLGAAINEGTVDYSDRPGTPESITLSVSDEAARILQTEKEALTVQLKERYSIGRFLDQSK